MKNIIFIFLIICSITGSAQDYKITRFEQSNTPLGKSIFIAIRSTNTPLYIERFFTKNEMADSTTIKSAISKLIAQLSVNDSLYSPPPAVLDKMARARKYIISQDTIKAIKRKIKKALKAEGVIILKPDTIYETVF
ncbi:MAG: hypothetical protein WCJ95_09660 [Mariniphaga sp.]